jgi:hypothetical protein
MNSRVTKNRNCGPRAKFFANFTAAMDIGLKSYMHRVHGVQ